LDRWERGGAGIGSATSDLPCALVRIIESVGWRHTERLLVGALSRIPGRGPSSSTPHVSRAIASRSPAHSSAVEKGQTAADSESLVEPAAAP
jgi:hypothetical protein